MPLPAITFDLDGFSVPLLNAATGKIFFIVRRVKTCATERKWYLAAYHLADFHGTPITAPVSFVAALMLAEERVSPKLVVVPDGYRVTELDRQTNFGFF